MIVIHRDIPGEHKTDSEHCWCEPHIVQDDDLRTTDQIMKEIAVKELRQ